MPRLAALLLIAVLAGCDSGTDAPQSLDLSQPVTIRYAVDLGPDPVQNLTIEWTDANGSRVTEPQQPLPFRLTLARDLDPGDRVRLRVETVTLDAPISARIVVEDAAGFQVTAEADPFVQQGVLNADVRIDIEEGAATVTP